MAEGSGLLNRRRVNALPRVRISPSPPKKSSTDGTLFFVITYLSNGI